MHVSSESVVAVAVAGSLLSSASVVVSLTCPWMMISGSALVLMQSVDRDRERVHLIILLSLVVVVVGDMDIGGGGAVTVAVHEWVA